MAGNNGGRWEDQLGGYFMVQVRGDDRLMAWGQGGGVTGKGWDTGYILGHRVHRNRGRI